LNQQLQARALEILQERVKKRGHEIACRFVLAELGRGMNSNVFTITSDDEKSSLWLKMTEKEELEIFS